MGVTPIVKDDPVEFCNVQYPPVSLVVKVGKVIALNEAFVKLYYVANVELVNVKEVADESIGIYASIPKLPSYL